MAQLRTPTFSISHDVSLQLLKESLFMGVLFIHVYSHRAGVTLCHNPMRTGIG